MQQPPPRQPTDRNCAGLSQGWRNVDFYCVVVIPSNSFKLVAVGFVVRAGILRPSPNVIKHSLAEILLLWRSWEDLVFDWEWYFMRYMVDFMRNMDKSFIYFTFTETLDIYMWCDIKLWCTLQPRWFDMYCCQTIANQFWHDSLIIWVFFPRIIFF